jgi:hypothetical protein
MFVPTGRFRRLVRHGSYPGNQPPVVVPPKRTFLRDCDDSEEPGPHEANYISELRFVDRTYDNIKRIFDDTNPTEGGKIRVPRTYRWRAEPYPRFELLIKAGTNPALVREKREIYNRAKGALREACWCTERLVNAKRHLSFTSFPAVSNVTTIVGNCFTHSLVTGEFYGR